MEVDTAALDHVVENMTYGVLEPMNTPICQRRTSLMPLLVQHNNHWTHKGSKGSLSFPPIDEVGQLQASNSKLKDQIGALVERHYQWKLAYILTVDKNCQMAMEYRKIDSEFLENNTRRDFGLTSWALTNELFPWDNTPAKKINNELSIID
jgi:hypothetical protein